ncbi:MAG TPA: CHAT domain-containing protein, partial [Xenococcaceae cyanobacterium]
GRLLKQQGDIAGAIAIETQAVAILQEIRGDLVATNPDLQFSFRDSVEPIYRDLVELLLSYNPSQENLLQARDVIESLQLAELENYFREACIDAKPKQIEQIDSKAAVIYPIILPERLGVIVSLPGSPLKYYEQTLPESEIEATLERYLQSLNPIYPNKQRLQLSQTIYDWLIKPSEAELLKHQIKTLVFVLDGSLRNLPMTALYDGKQYLVEKYGIALAPGLQLLVSESLNNQKLQAVVAGLSESSQGFAALPGVKTEMNEISQYIPAQLLLNEQFTNLGLREQLRETPSSLVHLATHGQFSSNPEETFILTWNDQIKVKEFEDLLRAREEVSNAQPIELLVMSACQTAAGDDRAALGIAGVAVRSGARSTIATLWSVKDESTVILMNKFYQHLATGSISTTKAEALRQAQVFLIDSADFNHPFYWSSFVLVGNWL